MGTDVRAAVESDLFKMYGRKPTKAELDKATEFMTLYLQAGTGVQKMIAEELEVSAKLCAQGKDTEATEYIHSKIREVGQ